MDWRRSPLEGTPGTPAKGPGAPGSDGPRDRRADGRLVPPAPIAARVRGLHFARILDLSRRGALAESTTILRPLERSELLIHFPDGPFVTQAMVQRCRAWRETTDARGQRILHFRSGLEFDSLSAYEMESLERSLRMLDAGASRPRFPRPRPVESPERRDGPDES